MAILIVLLPEWAFLRIICKMHVKLLAKSLAQSKNSINVCYYFVCIIIGQTNLATWCPSKLKKKKEITVLTKSSCFILLINIQPEFVSTLFQTTVYMLCPVSSMPWAFAPVAVNVKNKQTQN